MKTAVTRHTDRRPLGVVLPTVAVAVFAAVAALFLHLKPTLSSLGVGRSITPVGNTHCKTVPQLQACESKSNLISQLK